MIVLHVGDSDVEVALPLVLRIGESVRVEGERFRVIGVEWDVARSGVVRSIHIYTEKD